VVNSSIDHPPALAPPTLVRRIQSGVAFNLLGTAFNQGSTLVVNVVVANLLGRESFGHYTIILATVATVASLGQLSMGYTATKHVAEYRSTERGRTSRILALCGTISTVAAVVAVLTLTLTADWLAGSVLGAPGLAFELRLAGIAVFFAVLNGFFTGALAGLEGYPAIARNGVASGTVYTVLCITLAWTYGLSGAVWGLAISGLIQSAILWTLFRREAARCGIALTLRGQWQERTIVSTFAIPASLTGLITLPAIWISSALLARRPGGFEQLALFGAANSLRVMVLFLPQAINNVSMSLLNNQRRSSPEGYRRVFWTNAFATGVSAIGVALLLWFASPGLLRLFGPGFAEGQRVLGILLGAAVIEALAVAAYQVVVSHGRLWASFSFIALPRDVSLVVLAAMLAPLLGAVGLAAAHALAWTVALTATIALAWRFGLATSDGNR
jgi:O-antigen/teichoic acid export membrane protein